MTTSLVAAPRRSTLLGAGAAACIAALGCGALAARPALLARAQHPATVLVVLFSALLAVGCWIPLPHVSFSLPGAARASFVPLVVGVLAFGAGRVLLGGHAPTRFTVAALCANALAAIAEEAWFRRLCYGLLAPAGPVFAVAGTTILFAAVHVAIYGFWIVPLDLAAGALLGWQRTVTGSWAVPAATHVVANVLVLW